MTRLVAAAVAALACAGVAHAGVAHAAQRIALPSPIAPLSAEPPLSGGARRSAENVAHSVSATTSVAVAIDRVGTPFAVTATQRLDVRGIGDYFFTIGAPVLAVQAPRDSTAVPGMRTGSIIWAGFNPGERLLVARATLEPAKAVPALPLTIRVSGDAITLENTTTVTVPTFTADAPRPPLIAYLSLLRGEVQDGRTPLQTTVPIASTPTDVHMTVTAPLHVTGTIGARHVDLVLASRAEIRGRGRIDLHAEPVEHVGSVTPAGGRALLREAIQATLMLARANQYEQFLGNPDPAGASRTVYAYRTASPPHAAPIASVGRRRRTWVETALVVAALAAALAAGAAVWSRS
ncbi:MAG TPA: hypothetical protein VGI77_12755 [Gaiellaceae bacterium]